MKMVLTMIDEILKKRRILSKAKNFTNLPARRYRGKLDSDAGDFIRYIVEGVDRMSRLIKDVLAYSMVKRLTEKDSPAAGPPPPR